MTGTDPELQYHLATDASDTALGGCLFQLYDTSPGTEATPRWKPNERINMFLSYKLQDAETRYSNSERECYAIVKCLAEIRWLVMGSKYPVMVYTDHEALKPIFATGQTEKGRIATWLDKLGEFDFRVFHRSSRDQHIGVADGLSRMPTRLTTNSLVDLPEKIAMPLLESSTIQRRTFPLRIISEANLDKYRHSPMYHQLVDYYGLI